jgi:hypothetical protein
LTIKLKDLNKAIRRFKIKLVKTLQNGDVPTKMGNQISRDIKLKMTQGKITDGKGGTKSAPALTKKTQKAYTSAKISSKPRFQFSRKLIQDIKPTRNGNTVKIGPTSEDGRKKIKILNDEVGPYGLAKKRRPIMGWTKARTKIIKKIIRDAIKRNFS